MSTNDEITLECLVVVVVGGGGGGGGVGVGVGVGDHLRMPLYEVVAQPVELLLAHGDLHAHDERGEEARRSLRLLLCLPDGWIDG